MIEPWLQAVRDHPERPSADQRHVLTMLALRLDFSTGRGFASTGQLTADSDASETTIRRATAWAQKAGLLVQVRRGGRHGDGTVRANEWRIVISQSQISTGQPEISTGHPRPVETVSTGHPRPVEKASKSIAEGVPPGFKREEQSASRKSQPVAGGVPSAFKSKELNKLVVIAIAEVQQRTGRTITRADAERGIEAKLAGKHPGYPAAYLRKIIGDDPRWWLPTPTPPPYRKDNRNDLADPFACPE